jgi:hypothetical protein
MGSGFEVDVTDGTNNFKMFVDADTDVFGKPYLPLRFNLTGIGGQFDATSPFTEGYQIIPRYFDDIDYIVAVQTPDWAENIRIFPNPVSTFLTVSGISKVKRVEIFDVAGKKIEAVPLSSDFALLDVTDWRPGFYVISFEEDGEIWFQKFTVLK